MLYQIQSSWAYMAVIAFGYFAFLLCLVRTRAGENCLSIELLPANWVGAAVAQAYGLQQ